ncbi:MAG: DUF438 domain-containing protein [Promethearchaeota archaeon]
MGEISENKKRMLKELIKALHAGLSIDEAKERFKGILEETGPSDISKVEEELLSEGVPAEDIRRLCDVHLAVFKESLEKQEMVVPRGHPIYILLAEHKYVKGVVEEILLLLPRIKKASNTSEIEFERIEKVLADLKEYEKHKVREENSLFPYLEKHGVTQPPAIMWAEHNEQREHIKSTSKILRERENTSFGELKNKLYLNLQILSQHIPTHFYKEENILFPTSLRLITSGEWDEIKSSMDDLGYCYFTPMEAVGKEIAITRGTGVDKDTISFETGDFSKIELESALNTLPADLTFVDKDDTVRYFSKSKERIFPRTKAVIGRKVQNCHPSKSVHVVNQILDSFRKGSKDAAEFWIELSKRLIYIRYLAVRDNNGEYLGCLEVTQDITDIKKIEGEKRLLT